MSNRNEEDARDLSGDNLPGISGGNMFLSPDDAQGTPEVENVMRTPIRVLSSQSLAGEDFVLSQRHPLEFPADDILLSPFTPSEGTHTPPLSLPDPLTPPPLNQSTSSISRAPMQGQSNAAGTGSLSGRMRPPRVPQVSLQPSRGSGQRHGRGLSNSEFSFLSALTDGSNNDNHSHSSAVQLSSNISVPRRRTASWDFHETSTRIINRATDSPGSLANVSTQSTPVNLLQPILGEDFATSPPSSIVTDSRVELAQSVSKTRPRPQKSANDNTPVVSSNTESSSSSSDKRQAFGGNRSAEESRPFPSAKREPIWNPSMQQETGSFIVMTDESQSRTPPSTRQGTDSIPDRVVNSEAHQIAPKRYTVDDVLEAYPKEPSEEVLLMSKIESQEFMLGSGIVAPDVPLEIVSGLEGTANDVKRSRADDDQTTASDATAKQRQNLHSFGQLTKKLLDASPITKGGSGDSHKTGHHRVIYDIPQPMHAGEKMYEAAEALFGEYAEGADEELAEDMAQSPDESAKSSTKRRRQNKSYWRRLDLFRQGARRDFKYFGEFLGPHRRSIQEEFTRLLRWIMLPSLGVAALLFYVFENPQEHPDTASISWWLLFIGVRQCITLELARVSQLIFIDFFILRTRAVPRLFGPSLSLVLAQSKGWPFIFLLWAIWDFAILYGDRRFVHHWAYWQDLISLFSEENPSGDLTYHGTYLRILVCIVVSSIVVAAKRAVMGQIVGKRVVRNYREDLGRLLRKLILVSEVSQLSARIATNYKRKIDELGQSQAGDNTRRKSISKGLEIAVDVFGNVQQGGSFDYSDAQSAQSKDRRKKMVASEKLEIMELLEEWEEPELQTREEEIITMGTILQFRRALEFISGEYPFHQAFGVVRTRKDCVASAQLVFERLLGNGPGPFLDFDTLCFIARSEKGDLDRRTVKELIRVFRPNRDGQLSKLDFVKSVDSVYKSLRLLMASIQNSQQIDRAYESIVNVAFYAVLGFTVLGILGVDLQSIIIGLGSIVVSFAFMIGPASSKAVEGILFVLIRKPYDIGDRVNVDDPGSQADTFGGDSSWIVENVDLYTTTARLGTTRELATFSNGSLAGMRIMNLNRSDKPNVYLSLKFSVDSSLQQRQAFKRRITTFVKERPRQWIKVVDFRSTRVETDLGYVEYTLILQHRERWQNVSAILTSRGEVFNYSVELQKELNMKYTAPHVPVDIRRVTDGGEPLFFKDSFSEEPKKER